MAIDHVQPDLQEGLAAVEAQEAAAREELRRTLTGVVTGVGNRLMETESGVQACLEALIRMQRAQDPRPMVAAFQNQSQQSLNHIAAEAQERVTRAEMTLSAMVQAQGERFAAWETAEAQRRQALNATLRALCEEVQGLRLSVHTQQEAAKERAEALEAALDEAEDRNHMKYEELRLRGRDRDSRLQLLSDQVQVDRVRQRTGATEQATQISRLQAQLAALTLHVEALRSVPPRPPCPPHAAAARCPRLWLPDTQPPTPNRRLRPVLPGPEPTAAATAASEHTAKGQPPAFSLSTAGLRGPPDSANQSSQTPCACQCTA